jgi:Tol biopolymer transport system component
MATTLPHVIGRASRRQISRVALAGALIGTAVVAAALSRLPPTASAVDANASGPAGGVIAFDCEECGFFLPKKTIAWNGFRVRLRGEAFWPGLRWSPDGRSVVYAAGSLTLQSTTDPSVSRQLTHPPKVKNGSGGITVLSDSEPAWFPTGKRLVFVRAGALWTVGSDGNAAKRLHRAPVAVENPDVSHDGQRIAFDDANGHLWLTGRRGLTAWRLGPPGLNGSNPRWSPDDSQIAYLDEGQTLTILDLASNQTRDLSAWTPPAATDGYFGDGAFSWSPDGHWLAAAAENDYDCNDPTGPCQSMELWIINATTGAAHLIYQTPDNGYIDSVDWH